MRSPRLALAGLTLATLLVCSQSQAAPDAYKRHVPWFEVMGLYIETAQLAEAGRLEEAVESARKWLAAADAGNDTTHSAAAHQALASLFAKLGMPDSAAAHANEALAIAATPQGLDTLPSALLALADAEIAAGRDSAAEALQRRAAKVAAASRDSFSLGVALLDLGNRSMMKGRLSDALGLFDSAIVALSGVGRPVVEGAALVSRGRCLNALKKHTQACESFDQAFTRFYRARQTFFTDFSRLTFTDFSGSFFADWQSAWLAQDGEVQGAQLSALAIAERARAQALLDFSQEAYTFAKTDSAWWDFVPNPSRRFGPGRNLIAESRDALAKAIPPDCALVYYSQLPESLIVWVFNRGVLRNCRFHYPAHLLARLAPLAVATQDTSMAPPGIREWWKRQVENGAEIMDLALFAKFCFPDTLLSFVSGARELIIVPDGWLYQIPFAILPVGPQRAPLVSLYPLRFAPSLAFLAQLENGGHLQNRKPIEPKDVLVVGDPLPPPWDLPDARLEAAGVAGLFGVKPFVGSAAKESLVVARWGALRILHLATHALSYGDHPLTMSSYVALAKSKGFDGRLHAGEVMERLPRSQLELVVLSACQTAHGPLSETEGILGLPRALMANGARSVVASMWNLEDKSTSFLMQSFYTHLLSDLDRPSKAQALRRAMLDARRRWKGKPFYWGAFKLYGAQ